MGLKFIPRISTRRGALGCFSWNSSLLSARILSSGSQVHSVGFGYPSHLTRYFSFPRENLESIISSTTYSSSPSTMTGGGGGGCFCDAYCGGVNGVRNTSLNTGWIFFHVAGSLSLYDEAPTFFITVKGPCRLSSSFLMGLSVIIFVPSKYTL